MSDVQKVMVKGHRFWGECAYSPDDYYECGKGYYVEVWNDDGQEILQTELHESPKAAWDETMRMLKQEVLQYERQ